MPRVKIPKRLTEAEFNEVMQEMRLTEKHIAVAHAVLVKGMRRQEVEKVFNMPYVSIAQTLNRVWDKFIKKQDLPEGWETVLISLPPEEANYWLNEANALRAKLK